MILLDLLIGSVAAMIDPLHLIVGLGIGWFLKGRRFILIAIAPLALASWGWTLSMVQQLGQSVPAQVAQLLLAQRFIALSLLMLIGFEAHRLWRVARKQQDVE
jgi:hypothetical protein